MTALAIALTVVCLALCATAVYCVNVWAAVESGRGGDGGEGEEVNAVGFHAEYGSDDDDT